MVTDDAKINNELIVETVNDYPYESKNEPYNIDVAPIEPTHPPEYGWDRKPTKEEWRIAQSVPLHILTAKCVTLEIIKQNTGDLCSMTVLIVCIIQQQRCTEVLKVLLDSGSNTTLIHEQCLLMGAVSIKAHQTCTTITASGSFDSSCSVDIRAMQVPEVTNYSLIDGVQARLFNTDCQYDLILRRDSLSQAGIDIIFSTHTVHWLN